MTPIFIMMNVGKTKTDDMTKKKYYYHHNNEIQKLLIHRKDLKTYHINVAGFYKKR